MNWDLDPSACLEPTDFVNADHPAIVDCVGRLELARRTPVERAVRLFEFVRDDVEYEFAAKLKREEYVASYVLAEGKGFCVQKSVLLCALARAAAIPTALVMSDLRQPHPHLDRDGQTDRHRDRGGIATQQGSHGYRGRFGGVVGLVRVHGQFVSSVPLRLARSSCRLTRRLSCAA